MARRALLVGINDYRGISDLRGCINDVTNMRNILKTYLGFTNSEIRAVTDNRATKRGIMERLEYMAAKARPGDFMVFHFSGHGSRIRDRNGDELEDHLDELLCPWDMDWDGNFILDDDLDRVFKRIPDGALLEVILDCCHSGTGTRSIGLTPPAECGEEAYRKSRFLPPPDDIQLRHEGETESLGDTRGFQTVNRSGSRSTGNHVLWAGCHANQESADAYINGSYNGAFSYHFCKHMRETGGNITRSELIQRVRDSLRFQGYPQVPQLECMNSAAYDSHPFQFLGREPERRMLYLTTPYMRGNDVRELQEALKRAGYAVTPDGVFGPNTRRIVQQFQAENNLIVDGVAGSQVYGVLFGNG